MLAMLLAPSSAYVVTPVRPVALVTRCDAAQRLVVMKEEEEPKKKPGIDLSGL